MMWADIANWHRLNSIDSMYLWKYEIWPESIVNCLDPYLFILSMIVPQSTSTWFWMSLQFWSLLPIIIMMTVLELIIITNILLYTIQVKYAMYFSTLNKQKIIYFLSEIVPCEISTQITTQFLHATAPFSFKQFFPKIYFYIQILIYCL